MIQHKKMSKSLYWLLVFLLCGGILTGSPVAGVTSDAVDLPSISVSLKEGQTVTKFLNGIPWGESMEWKVIDAGCGGETGAGQAVAYRILVYSDGVGLHKRSKTPVDQALREIGWDYTAHYEGDFAGFEKSLSQGLWDAVVFSNEVWEVPPSTLQSLLDYVVSGGRLSIYTWTVGSNPDHALWKQLGFTWIRDSLDGTPARVIPWKEDHSLLQYPENITARSVFGGPGGSISGQYIASNEAAEPVAGFLSSEIEENYPAIVVANGGRTVFKSFRDFTGYEDTGAQNPSAKLWKNFIVNTLSASPSWLEVSGRQASTKEGPSGSLTLTFDPGGMHAGDCRARLEVVDGLSRTLVAGVPLAMRVIDGRESRVAEAPALDLGTAEGVPATTVRIPITLTGNGAEISATANDISFDTNLLEAPVATLGPAGESAGKAVISSTPSPGVFRVGVFGFNATLIEDGIVAYVDFTIKADAPVGDTALENSPSASDPTGHDVTVTGTAGVISVVSQSHLIQASTSLGGNISPSGQVEVPHGSDQAFTITPKTGFRVKEVLVDGVSQGAVGSYDFTGVTDDHTIRALFGKIQVVAPNGGEIWKRGTYQLIKWISAGSIGKKAKITLLDSKGQTYSTITSDALILNKQYRWKIPTSIPKGIYKILITSVASPNISDKSDKGFTISIR